MGKIINGKEISNDIKEEIKEYILKRKELGLRPPKIVSILVGNDGGSVYYINNQEKVALSLGCNFEKLLLNEDILEEELLKKNRIIKFW